MKVKLLKKIRKEWHIKHHQGLTTLTRKDFMYRYNIDEFTNNWLFFCQCYLFLNMKKFIDTRTIRKHKKEFNFYKAL